VVGQLDELACCVEIDWVSPLRIVQRPCFGSLL